MRNAPLSLALTALLLAPAAFAEPNAVSKERVIELVNSRCALCHGDKGVSASPLYPRLASQNHQYLAKQLADFQSGKRKSDTMEDMAAGLTAEEMLALGMYFEQQPSKPRQALNADFAAVGRYIFHYGNEFSGVAACNTCHGEDGHGTELLPRLAGQVPKYLELQLKSFNERERNNDIMHSIASKLTELETKAVAAYIGGLE